MEPSTLEDERTPYETQEAAPRPRKQYAIVCAALALAAAIIAVYGETTACAFDEGFHMLAAQLVKQGRRLYVDFFFPQAPLNVWWNAAWMKVFGDTWRTAHAAAILATVATVFLAVDFVFTRFRLPRWRLAVGLAAVALVGGNWLLVEFGPIGQAYALCMLLPVIAFRLAIRAVSRPGVLLTFLCGCAVGAAAEASLLAAPLAPVVLLWILIHNRVGSRLARFGAFVVGAVTPWIPVLWMFARAPYQVRFCIVDFHLFYRQVEWEGSLKHNLELMTEWINSGHALILALLAAAGFIWIVRTKPWAQERRAEFYLCGWMAAGETAYLCWVRPTFTQYFSLLIPFLGIPAAIGFYAVATRLAGPNRRWLPFTVMTFLLCVGLGRGIYDDQSSTNWPDFEKVARKVDEVTPKKGAVLSDEFVYFITRRFPPYGMESDDTHKLRLPADKAALLHVVPRPELVKWVKAGHYDTVESCDDDDDQDLVDFGLPDLYAQKAEIEGCKVYWQRKGK